MNYDEMIADLPDGCQIGLSERLLLRYLADHLDQARLSRGRKLLDLTDVTEFLREFAEATRPHPLPVRVEQPQRTRRAEG